MKKMQSFIITCYRKKGFKGKSYDDGRGGFAYMTSTQTEDKTVIIDFFNIVEFAVPMSIVLLFVV